MPQHIKKSTEMSQTAISSAFPPDTDQFTSSVSFLKPPLQWNTYGWTTEEVEYAAEMVQHLSVDVSVQFQLRKPQYWNPQSVM